MAVIAIVVCLLVLASLLCWVVVRLDGNAKLRSVVVDARIWAGINFKVQIERDTSAPDATPENLPAIAVSDDPGQSGTFTVRTPSSPGSQPPDENYRSRLRRGHGALSQPNVAAVTDRESGSQPPLLS